MNARPLHILALATLAALSTSCAATQECGEREVLGENGLCVPYVPRAQGFATPQPFQTNVSPDLEFWLAVDDVTGYEADRDQLVDDFLTAYTMVHEGSGDVLALEWTGEWADSRLAGFDLARVRPVAPLPEGRVDVLDTNLDTTQTFFVGDDYAPFIVRAAVDMTGEKGSQFIELIVSTSEPMDLDADDVFFRDLADETFSAVVRSDDDAEPFLPTYRISARRSLDVSPYFEVVFTDFASPVSGLPLTLTSNPIAFANTPEDPRVILNELDDSIVLQFWPLGLINYVAIDLVASDSWRRRAAE